MGNTVIIRNGRPVHTTKVSYVDRLSVAFHVAIAEKDAQIQALTERNEFLENLIAELAVQAYSKSPSA